MDPSDQNHATFTSNLKKTRQEFERLLAKFKTMDDPIERYIKRQEMVKLRSILKDFGEHVDIP